MNKGDIMLEVKKIEIESNGITSEHVLYFHENAKKLVTIFPGGGNDCKRPVLFYLTDYFARNNYDVLCISYTNLVQQDLSVLEKIDLIASAIYNTIMKSKEIKKYDEYIFISNSFGNIVSNTIKDKYEMDVKNSIYISPTAYALKSIQKYPGCIVSSTEDEYLTKEDASKLLTFSNSEILIFEGGNHALECDDTIRTIEFCKDAVEKVIQYVEGTTNDK